MGLTWIFGVLIVEVEELVPLAYIYTTLVAFQGVFIFLIFVVFSKQVREAYSKWWKVKVNESDVLSKLFGDNSSSSRKMVYCIDTTCILAHNHGFPCMQTFTNGTTSANTSKTSLELGDLNRRKISDERPFLTKSFHN